MKTYPLALFAALALTSSLHAQGPLSTGIVHSVSKEKGTLTLNSAQSGVGAIVYHGMDKAQILTVSGKPASLSDLTAGTQITIHYAKAGEQWVVSRVLVPDAILPSVAPTGPAVTSPAATDGDRTTNPGSNAANDLDRTTRPAVDPARDGDRTTQPGSKAATDLDRTTKPAGNAAADGDRTTKPGSNAANDGDRTTKPAGVSGIDGDRTTKPADGAARGLRRN